MTDPITDMLNRIRNAQAVRQKTVDIPFTSLKKNLADVFLKKGFINKVEKRANKNNNILKIELKYNSGGDPFISGIKRISKPGQKIYKKFQEIKKVRGGYGIAIISTNKGLLTDKEARKNKLGGEVLCEIW